MEYSPILSECCSLRSGAEPMEITLLLFTVCRHLTACCWITCCGAVVLLCAVVRCCCWRSSDCGHELLQNTPTLVSTPAQAAGARAQHSVVTRGDQSGLGSWVQSLTNVFCCNSRGLACTPHSSNTNIIIYSL